MKLAASVARRPQGPPHLDYLNKGRQGSSLQKDSGTTLRAPPVVGIERSDVIAPFFRAKRIATTAAQVALMLKNLLIDSTGAGSKPEAAKPA
jgi:hypothetical protein